MSLKGKSGARAAVLALVVASVLFCSKCGDVYRPVANPTLQPGGDPQRTAHALVVSSNGPSPNQGTAVIIDVSGDTAVAVFSAQSCLHCGVGSNPVYATNLSGTDFVVNRDANSVSAFTLPAPPSGSLNAPIPISLPDGASPVFAAAAQSRVFVAESALAEVADVSPASNSVTRQIPVGNNPVALVATPDGTKLYCLNQDDSSVSVIFPATDQVITTIPLAPTGTSPVWGAVSADGSTVFVLNQGSNTVPGTVSLIDTTSDTVVNTFAVGIGSKYIVYEATLNRAYVASPGANSPCGNVQSPCLYVFENNTGMLTPVPMSGAPCNAQHPISVTALADGTRVYVADDVTSSVCVLNTTNNTFTKSIPVGTAPVFIASNSDSTRVYTANSGSADVSIIQTSSDTTVKQNDGVTPLTICAGPTVPGAPCTSTFSPKFIAMTP